MTINKQNSKTQDLLFNNNLVSYLASYFPNSKNNNLRLTSSAFTIIELLVVTVIIGILATIVVVSYSGVVTQAKIHSLKSDLVNSAAQLEVYKFEYGYYPLTTSTDCVSNPTNSTNLCLQVSSGNDYTTTPYARPTEQSFVLVATNGDLVYSITESTTPAAVVSLNCPDGFIEVPGSVTYGTSDFLCDEI